MSVLQRIEQLLIVNNNKLDTLNTSINNLSINLTVENMNVDNTEVIKLLEAILRASNNQDVIEAFELAKSEGGS